MYLAHCRKTISICLHQDFFWKWVLKKASSIYPKIWEIRLLYLGSRDHKIKILEHTCRQNPRLSIDKSSILHIDCCEQIQHNLELFVTCPHLQLVYEQSQNFRPQTQVRDFVYKCVLNLKILQGIFTKLIRALYLYFRLFRSHRFEIRWK